MKLAKAHEAHRERGGERERKRERERERERELVETVELLSQRHQLALCRGEETERERERAMMDAS